MSKLFILLASAVFVFALLRWIPRLRNQNPPAIPRFIPDLENDKTIIVRGWREAEVAAIVKDFAQMYELTSELEIGRTELGADVFRVSFPEDLESDKFFFLVNYLCYPKDFELDSLNIGVLGRFTLTSQFDFPDRTLLGKHAEVYVPSNDDQFDTVYVRVESGQTYENSFAARKWKLVEEDRFPETARGL